MRVVVTSTHFDPAGLAVFNARSAELQIIDQDVSPEAVEKLAEEFDPHAIVSRGVRITARAIQGAPSLRVIAKMGAGVDNIDLDAATRRRIPVLKNFGANSRSVAEHSLALMLALARNVARHDAAMRAGEWSRFHFRSHELAGRRLGLVGFGQSAQILSSLAQAFGMRVSAYSPRLRSGEAGADVEVRASLNELLPDADILSLHCPLTQETRNMIDARALGRMKKGAWIVNVARGEVVDEDALIAALKAGQIGGAALDVYHAEPLPKAHPLLELPNVVLTPHVAGSTVESSARAHAAVARNVLALLDGHEIDPRTLVNPQAREA